MTPPKLFISYSWSNSEHEQWVIDLSTRLVESGIEVILDKWDLKEGHDAIAFMEQMVTDPNVEKVAIISDRTYSEKADGRSGGVGTETQIISKEVYEKQKQDKFVAIVSEKDESGKPFLPTYYKSRIYIDLSEPGTFDENFEKLLRWIFNKPLYIKPQIGKAPAFAEQAQSISLGTTASFKRALDSIRSDKPFALGAFDEYLSTFVENFERFRLDPNEPEIDDAVLKSLNDFLPFRNEFLQLLISINQYANTRIEFYEKLQRYFEKLIPFLNNPPQISQYKDSDFDNFRFFLHELFLYAVAIPIKFENFAVAQQLLQQQYYLPGNSDYGRNVMVDFVVMRKYMPSLEHRNKQKNLNRLSLRADLLKERTLGSGIEFKHLMQADFVLFMRHEVLNPESYSRWWPETLVYLGDYPSQFEIFARASSKMYFEKIKGLLGIATPQDLLPLFDSYRNIKRDLPRWQFNSFNPAQLLGYEQLATKP